MKFFRGDSAKNLMAFIVAASSVDHALNTLSPENRKKLTKRFSLPGLSLKPNKKTQKSSAKIALKTAS